MKQECGGVTYEKERGRERERNWKKEIWMLFMLAKKSQRQKEEKVWNETREREKIVLERISSTK